MFEITDYYFKQSVSYADIEKHNIIELLILFDLYLISWTFSKTTGYVYLSVKWC